MATHEGSMEGAAEPAATPGTIDSDPARAMADRLLDGLDNCPASVRRLVDDLVTVCREEVTGDLVTGAGVADRFTALARLRTVLDGEVGRTGVVAKSHDVLPHTPATHLQRAAQWSGHDAAAVTVAGQFADRHRALATLWREGRLSTAVVATIARGLRGLTHAHEAAFLAAVIDQLPQLSVAAVRVLIARTLDLLHPKESEEQEQLDWDRRCLVATEHGGMTMIAADLPSLEGRAVMAALDALADSLRAKDDQTTPAQRRADALITLVNRAAAHHDLPATRSGLPVATTITIGVSEADRVAAGQSAEATQDLTADLSSGRDPGALATSTNGAALTLGDAAVRFALCGGSHTPVLIEDRSHQGRPVSAAFGKSRLQPLAVGRSHRFATAAQRTALALRDGGCLLCQRPPAECQTHHVTDWADGGRTDVDEMVLLCWTHHRQVDLQRWILTRNPDTSSGQPHWLVTPVPRHRWRQRRPSP